MKPKGGSGRRFHVAVPRECDGLISAIQAAQHGDPAPMICWDRDSRAELVRAVERRLDAAGAREMVQDAVGDAYFAVERGVLVRNEPAWIACLLRTRVSRRLRVRARMEIADRLPERVDVSTPDRVLSRKEQAARVRAAVEALPKPWRTAVHLHWFDGFDVSQVVESLAVTHRVGERQVRKLLAQALQMIRSELEGVPARRGWPWRFAKKEPRIRVPNGGRRGS